MGGDLGIPTLVGRYALHAEIATGGMGVVHLGRLLGPAGFSRTVAIKCLHPHLARAPEFVEMFLDEARLAARVSHPNVVPTLDIVTSDDGLFVIMDYVHGDSLAALLRRDALRGVLTAPSIVAAIVSNVLHGLHAAHQTKNERGEPLGIVHRDVSPQNVLVGADGVARLIDFGVAKVAGRLGSTRAGELKGKLAYMPPEQLNGEEATRQSDIYAAAVVLWEALTGQRLFREATEGATVKKILFGIIEPPSRIVPGISPEVDALVMRGLAPDPAERFASARDMAVALQESIKLAAPNEVGEWVEGNAAEVLLSRSARISAIEAAEAAEAAAEPAGAAAVVASGVAARAAAEMLSSSDLVSEDSEPSGRAPQAPVPATPWRLHRGDQRDSRDDDTLDGPLEAPTRSPASARPQRLELPTASERPPTRLPVGGDEAAARPAGKSPWGVRLAVLFLLAAAAIAAIYVGGRATTSDARGAASGAPSASVSAPASPSASASASAAALDAGESDVDARKRSAEASETKGDVVEAANTLEEALKVYPRDGDLHVRLAQVQYRQSKYDEAEKHVQTALKLDGPHVARAHYLKGFLLYRKGSTAAAQKELEKAVELQPTMAEAYYQLGQMQAAAGKADLARKSYERAVKLRPEYTDAILALRKLDEK